MFSIAKDPLQALAGEKPLLPGQRAQLTAQYHLDEPFIVQYGYYMKGLVTGHLGKSAQWPAHRRHAGRGLAAHHPAVVDCGGHRDPVRHQRWPCMQRCGAGASSTRFRWR